MRTFRSRFHRCAADRRRKVAVLSGARRDSLRCRHRCFAPHFVDEGSSRHARRQRRRGRIVQQHADAEREVRRGRGTSPGALQAALRFASNASPARARRTFSHCLHRSTSASSRWTRLTASASGDTTSGLSTVNSDACAALPGKDYMPTPRLPPIACGATSPHNSDSSILWSS